MYQLRRRDRREAADIEHRPEQFRFGQDRLRLRKQVRAAECLLARLRGSSVGSFHELKVRLQCRVPLDHPPLATLTIMATAVSNGQLGITHAVTRTAMRTTKVKLRNGRRAAHNCILHVVCESKSPAHAIPVRFPDVRSRCSGRFNRPGWPYSGASECPSISAAARLAAW